MSGLLSVSHSEFNGCCGPTKQKVDEGGSVVGGGNLTNNQGLPPLIPTNLHRFVTFSLFSMVVTLQLILGAVLQGDVVNWVYVNTSPLLCSAGLQVLLVSVVV